MNYVEEACVFPVAGERLLGIVARPDVPLDCGVLIVVGGPQYRVGSHRHFLLLARSLAAQGYPVMRFDYRGMGDSEGSARDFLQVSDDISAAIDALILACPGVRRVVLWGLCDAASAALLYVAERSDFRVVGLALLNPWVRSEASLARTHLKHYYGQRLLQREFWRKLFGGGVNPFASIRGFVANLCCAGGTKEERDSQDSFQERMAKGLREFSGEVLLILSGQDYTAKEFLEFAGTNASWSGLLDDKKISRVDFSEADHTFSSEVHRLAVESHTLSWLGNRLA